MYEGHLKRIPGQTVSQVYRYTMWFEKDTYCDTFLLCRFTQKHKYVSVYVRETLHAIIQKIIFLSEFLF